MWAELQATKDTLRLTEEEMNACKREKVRFLETLTKIAVDITFILRGIHKVLIMKYIFYYFSVVYTR